MTHTLIALLSSILVKPNEDCLIVAFGSFTVFFIIYSGRKNTFINEIPACNVIATGMIF